MAYASDMALTAQEGGFYLDDERTLLVSGSVHYWRLDRSRWGEILDRVREMGFSVICTYIPWGVHEISPGEFDFGEVNLDYDLNAFLTLCEDKDLRVLLRPGPHVNSEITYFGFPKRVLEDPMVQSVTADGTSVVFPSPPRMFPVPSYASEKFYQEVGIYFDRVCPIIRDHLHPQGCVIAVQADNEMSFFLRTQPYDHDYSTGAIRLYVRFLKEKYRDINLLNELYRTDYASFDKIPPPRNFDARNRNDIPYYLDWIEYKEYYLQYGLARITAMLRERGVTTLIYHNLPGVCIKPPYNQIKMEEIVDAVGFDLYYYKEEYHKVKRCVQYLNSTSRAPFIPEFASGFVALPIPVKPIMLDDAEFTTYAALMHGFSGINFYMLVERERWVGSPIDRFGGVRKERFRFYQRFNRIIKRINYQELRIKCEGILLINRDCARLELASSLLTPIPILGGITPEYYVSEGDLGFDDVIQLEYGRQWDALYYGFGAAKYAVTIGDTELPLERLSGYRVVAVPAFDFMSRDVQDKLINYVKGGGCLVMGPRSPEFDEHTEEFGVIGEYLPKPDGRIGEVMVEGIKLKDVDIFDTGVTDGTTDDATDDATGDATGGTADAVSVLTADPGTIIYQQKIGSGSIIHFGFLFPRITEDVPAGVISIIDRIAAACGMRRVIPCTDPQIDATVHIADGADGREVLFVANTGMSEKEVDIGGIYLDPDSEEMVGPMIRVPAYTVRILEVASHDR